MTIGDKIKYFRRKQGITQGALAELSEIHPVSIRKYETNKMQPQPAQIERIATALNVSYTALIGISSNTFRLETIGDFMGFIMVMYDSGILQVKGTRNNDGSIQRDTFNLKFSPILTNFFELQDINRGYTLDEIMIYIKDEQILVDFLNWEKLSYRYTKALINATEKDTSVLEELFACKTSIELELQSSTSPLII